MHLNDSAYSLLQIHFAMQVMLVVWIILVTLTVQRTIAIGSVGLPTALVFTMSFLYGGCFVYAVPGYTHLRPEAHWYLDSLHFTEWQVIQATFASLLGLLGFALGSGVFRRPRRPLMPISTYPLGYRAGQRKVLLALGIIGAGSFVLHYLGVSFPMSGALLEFGRNLAVATICIGAYRAWSSGRSVAVWMAVASLIPLYYLAFFGFVSYGFMFAVTMASFWLARTRKSSAMYKLRLTLLILATVWLLLTFFVAWFSFRDQVRLVVWEGAGGSLWSILMRAIAETDLFSPWNYDSLDVINIRLNLNLFIGRMIDRHQSLPELQEWGATLIILPLVIVPRFIWPGKPERGGNDFMEEHTGMLFADAATFGTGTVFELFINFGYVGVFLGFCVLGWIIRRIDIRATYHLANGDIFKFAQFFVVGIVALDPLLRPFFIVNGAVFAWIMMTVLRVVMNTWISNTSSRASIHSVKPPKG